MFSRKRRSRVQRIAPRSARLQLETLEARVVPAGTWTALAHQAPNGGGTMQLLPNGNVMVITGFDQTSNQWYELSPDASGSYVNGNWSQLAPMSVSRLFFGSALLPTDKFLVIGGEYASGKTSGGVSQGGFTASAEIYNVLTNSWHGVAPYPFGSFGDDPIEVLNSGLVLEGYVSGPQTELYNPATNSYSPGGTKLANDQTDEECWVKLPNGDILSYDIFASIQSGVGQAQYYDPSTNQWFGTGNVPVPLSSYSLGAELGPGMLLPNGLVFQLGANDNTALYDYRTNTWSAGPTIPNGYGADDAPAAELPDGNVVFAADAGPVSGTFSPPSEICEYNWQTNSYSILTPPDQATLNGQSAFLDRMLMLPNGQLLFSDSADQLYVYTDTTPPPAANLPTITGITLKGGNTFTLSGTQFNGPSEGAAYGDDVEEMSNYPIVTLTDAGGNVNYMTTSNWSNEFAQTGNTPVTTDFTEPNGFGAGAYLLDVSGAGVNTNNVAPGTPANTALYVQMGAVVANDVTIQVDPTNAADIQVLQNGSTLLGTFPETAFSNIYVLGDGGTVSLTINDANGDPVPANGTLSFDGAGGSATLVGPDTAGSNDWEITGTDTGTLNNNISFVNVQNLTGGSGDDVFTFQLGGQITGSLNGGPLPGFDTLDLSQVGQGVPVGLSPGSLHGFQDVSGAPPAITGTFDNIDFIQTAGTRLVVTTPPPAGILVGATFGMTVAVEDGSGNVNPTFSGQITAIITPGTGAAGATLGGTNFANAINGVATFSGLTLDKPGAGSNGTAYELELSTPGLAPVDTPPFDVSPSQPNHLAVTTQPPGVVTAGQSFTFFVKAEDPHGFVATQYNANVQVTLFNNPGSNAPISFVTALTNGVAVVTVPAGALTKAGLGYNFEITDVTDPTTVNPTITNNINVVAGSATQIVLTGEPPGSLIAGTKFSVSALAEDNYFNVDTSFSNSVTITLTTNPGNSTLGGNTTISANRGIISFSDLTLNRVGNGYLLTLSSIGLSPATTTGIDISAGLGVELEFTSAGQPSGEPPASIPAGSMFGVVVYAEDYLGNLATGFDGDVVLSLADNPTGGALLGPLTQTASNGVALFPGLSIDTADTGSPNGYALLASVTDGSLTPGTSNRLDVTALAATHLAIVGQPPASIGAGKVFSTSVAGVDQYGNVDPHFAGSVSMNFAPGGNPSNTSLGGTLMQSASGGVATFGNLSLTAAAPGYQLQAIGLVQGSASAATTNLFTITAETATQFVVTTEPGNVTVNSPIIFTVSAEDQYGNVDPTFNSGVKAAVANNVSGAALGGTLNQTASAGVVTFSDLTLNKPGVGYTLKATSGGLSAPTTPFTVTAGHATQLSVTSIPSPGVTAGTLFTVIVSAEDQYGFLDQTYNGQVTIALAANPGNTSLGGILSVGAFNGVATFSNLQLNAAAKGYSIQTTSAGLSSGTSGTFNVTAGKATQLVVTTQPGSVIAGQSFGMVVSAEDSYFNLDSTFTGNVALALGANPGVTSLLGNTTATAVNGVATFGGLKLDVADPGYTIQATGIGVNKGTTNPFTVTAGQATQLAVIAQPGGVVAGTGFSFSVAAEDSLGNVDQTFTGNVAVSLFANPGSSTLGGSLYAKAVKGVATFTGLTLNAADPGYILQAIYSGLSPITTASFTVTAAHATKLVFQTEPPASVTAGSPFGFVLLAEDSLGNLDQNFAGTVTAVIGNNPGNSKLGGAINATVNGGVVSFSTLSLNVADPGYTLQILSSGLTSATTSSITVNAGKATQLVTTLEPPASVGAGNSFAFVVTAEDAYNNIDTTFNGLVAPSLANNPGNSTLSSATPVAAASGVATFANLSLNKSGINYTLQASTSGLTSALSTAFSVTPASATHLAIVNEPPANVTAGQGFGFSLDALDSFGNIDTNFTGFVLASIVNNSGNSILGGNLQATVSSGVVTFSGLTLNKVGIGYTLQANSLGLATVPTTAMNVVAGAATQLVVTTQPSGVVAGQGFGFTVTAEDNFFNVDATFGGTVSVALASNPGNTSLGGVLNATASQGVASFSGLTINVADPNYTLKASFAGLNAGITNPFTVTPGHATRLVMVAQPPISITAGSGFGFVVDAVDPLGNIDLSFTAPVTVAILANPGSSTLGGSPFADVSGGVATFSGLSLNVADPGYTLQASSPGLSPTTTNPVAVTPGAATQLVVTTEPPQSLLVDQIFGMTVKAEDAEDNVDPNFNSSISLALLNNPGNANLGGNTSLSASSGVATFTGLTVNQAGGGDTIQATANGLFSGTTTPFSATFSVPTTTATLTGTQGSAGWYRSAVSVTLSATDPIFSVAQVFYSIDGGAFKQVNGSTATFPVTGEGVHTVSYYSVNSAGKQESTETTTVQIDTIAPVTTASTSGIKGSNGYYTALSLSLSATDATSGVATTYYTINGSAAFPYSGPVVLPDGKLSITYYSVDVAGNQEIPHSLSAQVDSTPPTTTANISGKAGLNGYYISAVKVTLSATDNVSGVAATYYRQGTTGNFALYRGTAFSFTTQGSHTITYYSVDRAGNKENVETTTVLISTTAPPLTVTSITAANVISEVVGLTGVSQANATITVVVTDSAGKIAVGQAGTDSSGNWTLNVDVSKLANGTLTAQVTATSFTGTTRVVTKKTTKSSQEVMVLTQAPVNVSANSTMPSVVVQLEDGAGHNLALSGVDVTVTVLNYPSGTTAAAGTFTGTTPVTSNSLGQVVFTDLTFETQGSYTLEFTATGLTTIVSKSFTVS